MYVVPATIETVLAYARGVDTGTGCLTGFREWLVVRFDDGNNLAWEVLVKMVLEKESIEEPKAVARLGSLLAEFQDFTTDGRSSHTDLTRVYLRYHAWLLNRSWYRPGFPGYMPPYDGVPIPRSLDAPAR
jgi:hypothetical protein